MCFWTAIRHRGHSSIPRLGIRKSQRQHLKKRPENLGHPSIFEFELRRRLARPHSKSLSSGRFQVFRHRRTSLWLAGVGFQAADAADEQVLSGHRRGLLHNTHICRCLEAYSSRGAFFSELQSGQIQAACSSSSRRRFFISMMRQQL